MKFVGIFIAVVAIARMSQGISDIDPYAVNNLQNEVAPFPGLSDCDNPVLDCATMKSLCTSPGVWYQDQDVCYCKCPEWVSQTCPKHQYFDRRICRCTCFEPLECRRCSNNQFWNEKTCSCGCPRPYKCPKNQHFSHLSCQCECNQQPRDCCTGSRPAKIWDQKLCDCTCAEVKCCATWAGYFWHPHLCKCVSKFRSVDYAYELEKIQSGIDDCEGVCPNLSSTTSQTSTTSTTSELTTSTTRTTVAPTTTPEQTTTTSTTIDPIYQAIQTIAAQRALLQSFIPRITSQTNITPHHPCYDTSLANFQNTITAIDALLPLIMTAQNAQDAVTAINTSTNQLFTNLSACNAVA